MPVIIYEHNNELETDQVPADGSSLLQPDVAEEPHNKKKDKARKVLRNRYSWKSEERKRKYQSGQEHVNSINKLVKQKEVLTIKNCNTLCKFKCSSKIKESDRRVLLAGYYRLDQNGKYHYINKTTERVVKNRKTRDDGQSRRNYSFKINSSLTTRRLEFVNHFI